MIINNNETGDKNVILSSKLVDYSPLTKTYLGGKEKLKVSQKKEVCARDYILKHYKNINYFCIYHKIYYSSFCRLLDKYPDLSLSKIMTLYKNACFYKNSSEVRISGVTLQAICLKYQLNYSSVQSQMTNGVEPEDFFLKAVLTSPVVSLKMKNCLLQNYELFKIIDGEKFKSAISKFEEYPSFYKEMLACYSKYHQILDALNVYGIINWFINDWQYDNHDLIAKLNYSCQNSDDFFQKFKNLKRESAKRRMEQLDLSKMDLQFYYDFYYDDYFSICVDDVIIHQYNRKKTYKI